MLFLATGLQLRGAEPIAAKIDQETISRDEVDRELQRAVAGRKLTPEVEKALRKITLEKLIERRLVLRNLTHLGLAASDEDLRQFALRQEAKLKASGSSLDEYLSREKLTKAAWRQEIHWQLTWNRYLDEKCNDENLAKYYERNRPHFDGRERKVAHILWKISGEAADKEQALREQIANVRTELTSGKLTFAEGAKLHSQSPTAKDRGEIGWISRHDPMPEEFSRVAFDLKMGEISQPVKTKFGWHLIRFTEERTAKEILWHEIRPELRTAIAQYLFEFHARQERMRTSPHIEVLEVP